MMIVWHQISMWMEKIIKKGKKSYSMRVRITNCVECKMGRTKVYFGLEVTDFSIECFLHKLKKKWWLDGTY